MAEDHRKRGGDSNKRGNRYEDSFASFLLARAAPQHITGGARVRVKEQAGCPVDDFLLEEPKTNSYHQLKADKAITWGESKGKLEKEFLEQKKECEARKESFKLIVVVADKDREKSLTDNMPEQLSKCTSVFLFPVFDRPSSLAMRQDILGDALANISAARGPSITEHEHIVRAFHLAWVEHESDAEGFCVLERVIAKIHEWGIARLRREWKNRPDRWKEAEAVLSRIPGLRWSVDRGYFEWEYPPADSGLFAQPCDSDSFSRFIDRVIETRPTSFEEFERLLP